MAGRARGPYDCRMSGCDDELEVEDAQQARVLRIVLGINFSMFVGEAVAGLIAGSVALLADSLDMLADASVYGLSLYAVRRADAAKARAAAASGVLQIALGLGLLLEALRRIFSPVDPEPGYMMLVAAVALVANVICLRLIAAHRRSGVHMRASVIFSENDVIANCAVILGGLLVFATGWHQIDLAVGGGIAFLIASGGIRILKDVRASSEKAASAIPGGAE